MYHNNPDDRRCLCLSCHERVPGGVALGCGLLAFATGFITACLTCGISCSSAPVLYIALSTASGGAGATAIGCCCCYCNPKGLCDANSAASAARKEYYKTFSIQASETETTPLSVVAVSPYSTNNASTLWSTTSEQPASAPSADGLVLSINNNP